METLTKKYLADLSDDSIWIFNTPSELTKSFLLYVQELGLIKAMSKYYATLENISSFLIMLTTSGIGEYIHDHKTHELTAGKLVFVDSMEYHTHKTSPKSKGCWEVLWVQFNGIVARGYYSQYQTKNIPVLDAGGNPRIRACLEKLVETNRSASLGREFMSSKLLVDLLTEILFTAGAVVSPKINVPGFIQAAIQDIDAHFSSNLSLAYFSNKLKINKYHFAKVFKKYTGFSPIEYIINTRINNAKEFLQYSDATISEISALVGFHNTCHFINTFKQKAGFTPLTFRKQYQANLK